MYQSETCQLVLAKHDKKLCPLERPLWYCWETSPFQIGPCTTDEERYKLHPAVPQDFKTIQGSINFLRGKNGRTILVSCGTYSEAIILEYTEVTIKAVKGEVIFQRKVDETDVPNVRIKSGTIKLVGIKIIHGCKGTIISMSL